MGAVCEEQSNSNQLGIWDFLLMYLLQAREG